MAARCSKLYVLLSYRSRVVRKLETAENFVRRLDTYLGATELQLEMPAVTWRANKCLCRTVFSGPLFAHSDGNFAKRT